MIAKSMCPSVILMFICLLAGCTSSSHGTTSTSGYTLPGGGACVRLGAAPHAPYTNVPVGQDTYLAHSEPMLAENPNNPLQLVGGSKFFTDPAHYAFQIGTYASTDGGCSWTAGALLPDVAPGQLTSDPTFAFGPHGEVYASVLYRERNVLVFASPDGGKTFGMPVHAFPDSQGVVVDKPWIGVDQQTGALIIVSSYAKATCGDTSSSVCSEIAFVRSTDGGHSFNAPRFIEGTSSVCSNQSLGGLPVSFAHQCLFGLGTTPVIDAAGHIAVDYLYVNPDTNKAYQLIVISHDDGQTWSQPIIAASVHNLSTTFTGQKYRVTPLPAFIGDPHSDTIYLAWADAQQQHADILVATSADFGQTWSKPTRVNDNTTTLPVNDSQPQLAIAPNGVVSLSFLDSRNDPQGHLLDVYLSQSVAHGTSWLPNVRVTTTSWNPDTGAPIDADGLEFIGDYQGLAADDLFVHPFWNDSRSGRQMIFTAAIPSAQPLKPSAGA